MADETSGFDLDGEDRELLNDLAAMFQEIDPVPDHVVAAALAAPSVVAAWRQLDAGLLAEIADSALEPAAGIRAGGGPRLVTFGSGDGSDACSVEVEVGVEPSGTLRLIGMVVPTGPGELEVRHPGGAIRVPVDELGRFRAAGVPAGPLSLVMHGSGPLTVTDWITV